MIKSRLTRESRKKIIEKIDNFYIKTINAISKHSGGNNVGGKIRQAMGDLGEELATVAWMEVAKLYSDLARPVKPKKGEYDKKECLNKRGNTYWAHVDRHCYIGDKFVLAIESKSYLDACYYVRASNDFRLLKEYFDVKLICAVLSIEDATKESSKKFIEDEGWIDATFILADGKRSSAKPIWNKKFRKKLDHGKIEKLVDFLNGLFCGYLEP